MADSILDKIISSKHAEEAARFIPEEILNRLLSTLSSRERGVIVRRFGLQGEPEETLEHIGVSLEVTRERVRQIERGAIEKMRHAPIFSDCMTTVDHVVTQYLEESGGALGFDDLLLELVQTMDRKKENRSIVQFFLLFLIPDRFQRITEDGEVVDAFAIRRFSFENARVHIQNIEEVLKKRGTPVNRATLLREYRSAHPDSAVTDEEFSSLMRLARRMKENPFGELGLQEWATITPKRMADKIYLVLKHHGKPLHFNDITKRINDARFDQKVAHGPTVHNELIMDARYVLVGRGIYALKEWGYKSGVVADVLHEILREAGEPLKREQIVERVLKQRLVGKATVHLALLNRKRFTKLPDGRYTIASA